MRATIQSADLAAALKHSVAPGNSPLSMLMHARLATCANGIIVETTDTEVWMRTTIPADVETHGTVLLRESLLRPVAAVDGDIRINADGHLVRGASRFRVPALEDYGWPTQERSAWKPLEVDPQALTLAIGSVAYASTDDDYRPALNGLHLVDGSVWATDAISIGYVRIDYKGPAVTIPDRRVRQVLAVLGEGALLEVANVSNGIAGNLRITCGGQQLSLRLVSHKPHGMREVIADLRYSDKPLVLKRAELLAAVKRFMPFAQPSAGSSSKRALHVVVLESDGVGLTLADRMEESRESLDQAIATPGAKFRAALDPRHLIASVGAVDSDRVVMHPPLEGAKGVFALYAANANPSDEAHYVAPYTL